MLKIEILNLTVMKTLDFVSLQLFVTSHPTNLMICARKKSAVIIEKTGSILLANMPQNVLLINTKTMKVARKKILVLKMDLSA